MLRRVVPHGVVHGNANQRVHILQKRGFHPCQLAGCGALLKIDQTFVSNMLIDAGDKAIISGLIGLAAAFDRTVIAEGVETIAHARSLLDLGCSQVQGYGIARPMPAEALPEWIDRWPDGVWASVGDEQVIDA